MAEVKEEKLENRLVVYTLFKNGQFYIVENVPARVDAETGEQYFASETVERLQEIVQAQAQPVRVIQTPVFEFAA